MKKQDERRGSASIFLIFAAVLSFGVSAWATSVDPAYNAVPALPLQSEGQGGVQQAIIADEKIIVWGAAISVEGEAKGKIARLNSDGSLDTGFNFCSCGVDDVVNAAPLPDGSVLVAGSSGSGYFRAKVIRLHPDGSLDTSFSFAPESSGDYSFATIAAVRPDGKFYLTEFWSAFGFSSYKLYRRNADGSPDASFSPIQVSSGSPAFGHLGAIELLPSGSFYLAVNTVAPFNSTATLKRYTESGQLDSTWTAPNILNSSFPGTPSINSLDSAPDGSLLVYGTFTSINGVPTTNLARLLPAGNVDLTFAPPPIAPGYRVKVLADRKILIGQTSNIIRLNANGSLDNTYVMDPSITTITNAFDIDASERVVFSNGIALVRLLSNGTLDTSFSTNMGVFGKVYALVPRSDGKVYVAGAFTKFNGSGANGFVLTNSDGSRDASFDPGSGFNTPPSNLYLQPDGKIIAIGDFSSYNGTAVQGIVRVLPDGSRDAGFALVLNSSSRVNTLSILGDGRIYLGGNFATVGGVPRAGVARVNADGSLDATFNAQISGSPNITAVAVQNDGKVLIGGQFSGIGGFNRSGFARVDASGALDQSFAPSNTVAGKIYLGPDGKIYTTSTAQTETLTILRRSSNGTVDTTFAATAFKSTNSGFPTIIDSILVRSDGTLIVAGQFDSVGGTRRPNIARLAPNGTLDTILMPEGADARVRSAAEDSGGKVLIGGDFTLVQHTPKAGIARLILDPYRKTTLYDADGDGRADFTVYRPSTTFWYSWYSGGGPYTADQFGAAGDIPVPADYDGDGKMDLAVFRGSTGDWWYRSSITGGYFAGHLGAAGDRCVPTDIDGDGKTDLVVYRPSTMMWYRFASTAGMQAPVKFGTTGDIPLIGDFDGDGKGDLAVFRPSTGDWWYAASSEGALQHAVHWGAAGDIPVPADYDGDGKTDHAVFRPSERAWYVLRSSDASYFIIQFGLADDLLVPADYDGDGKADIAVYRRSSGTWYTLQTTAGFAVLNWGVSTDVPAPNSFIVQEGSLRRQKSVSEHVH